MTKPVFSIIVPVYKTEQYLHECMESILNQTYNDFEVIAVDDGSPDNSGSILDEYSKKDNRVKVIHKENGGLVSARKAGIKNCTGQYVLNVDSDDYVDINLLETLSVIMKENDFPDVIAFDHVYFSPDAQTVVKSLYKKGLYTKEKLKTISENIIYDKNLMNINMSGMPYSICLKAIKREIMEEVQLNVPDEISRGEDLAVSSIVLSSCESLYICDFLGYYYRNNPKSIVHNFNPAEILKTEKLCKYLDSKLGEKYENNINVYSLRCCQYYIFTAVKYFKNSKEFVNCFRENVAGDVKARIQKAKVYRPTLKERVFIYLVKLNLWGLLWKIYK